MSPKIRIAELVAGWVLWSLPFMVLRFGRTEKAVKVKTGARWGILVTACGFMIALTHSPKVWNAPIEPWRAIPGGILALAGAALGGAAVRHLGRQWRFDAGVVAGHKLVRTGPYGFVRHPIYLSMFLMLLAVISLAGTLPGWPFAILLFGIGTEIRMRVEDRLLDAQFGEQFRTWRDQVPAWLPGVR